MEKFKFIDLFCGIGGFHQAMADLGGECVYASDIDADCRKTYERNYGIKPDGDITKVETKDIPAHDVLCGGFPCQAFSKAGKRLGFEDPTKGTLFFDIMRIANYHHPKYMLLENVRNLASHDEGNTWRVIHDSIVKAGYNVIDEPVIFSPHYIGVPQHRERVYIVGHLRGAGTREVFPITRKSSETSKTKIVYEPSINAPKHQGEVVLSPKGCAPTLTATDYKRPYKVAVKQVGNIIESTSFGGNPQRGRIYSANGLSPTLNTAQGGGLEPKVLIERPQRASQTKVLLGKYKRNEYGKAIRKAYESGKIKVHRKDLKKFSLEKSDVSNTLTTVQNDNLIGMVKTHKIKIDSRRFKENGKPTFLVNVDDRNGVMLKNGDVVAIRKLTPRECWRLQGFSDEQFEKAKKAGISDTQLYKQAGNAVTVDVIEQIGKRLVLEDDEAKRSSNFGINYKN